MEATLNALAGERMLQRANQELATLTASLSTAQVALSASKVFIAGKAGVLKKIVSFLLLLQGKRMFTTLSSIGDLSFDRSLGSPPAGIDCGFLAPKRRSRSRIEVEGSSPRAGSFFGGPCRDIISQLHELKDTVKALRALQRVPRCA